MDLDIAAAERATLRWGKVDRYDERVVGPRLAVVLDLNGERAGHVVDRARAPKRSRIAGNYQRVEHHAVNLIAGSVIDVLELALNRAVGSLLLHYEPESSDAVPNIDGATAGYLADGRTWREHDVGDLRDESIADAVKRRVERPRSCWEVG